MKIPNCTVNGITFIDCESIDLNQQPECPLVKPGLGHLCVNEYRDPRYRKDEPCEHKEFCSCIAAEHAKNS